jgi:hypothetical protein
MGAALVTQALTQENHMDQPNHDLENSFREYAEYLEKLFFRAFSQRSFDTLCTVLRVGGMTDANWDPMEESIRAFEDCNSLLEKASERSEECALRLNLLMYCQAVEMTAAHEILMNLLRCCAGEPYLVEPFFHLRRVKKNDFMRYVPPSAKAKITEIKKIARSVQETKLVEIIDSFFNDGIRNAFSHSDYIIEKGNLRWTEGGPAHQMKKNELDEVILSCFAFYGALLQSNKRWLKLIALTPRFHKWQRYEVLEILRNKEDGVYGFSVHFSNGNKATYERTMEGTKAVNVFFENDGTINFFVGSLDELEKVWKVNGREIADWSAFEKEETTEVG